MKTTFLPVESIAEGGCSEPATPAVEGQIEIDLVGGHRLRITCPYDPELFMKRLEQGRFVWRAATGGKVALTPAQLRCLSRA